MDARCKHGKTYTCEECSAEHLKTEGTVNFNFLDEIDLEENKIISKIIITFCLFIGSILLGYGTNWMIGLGVFFIQLTTLLMMER